MIIFYSFQAKIQLKLFVFVLFISGNNSASLYPSDEEIMLPQNVEGIRDKRDVASELSGVSLQEKKKEGSEEMFETAETGWMKKGGRGGGGCGGGCGCRKSCGRPMKMKKPIKIIVIKPKPMRKPSCGHPSCGCMHCGK